MVTPDLKWIFENYTISDLINTTISRTRYYIESNSRKLINKNIKSNELDYDSVEIAINKGRKWLEDHQRSDGSIGAIEPRQWEIWNTANAALAMMELDGDKKVIDDAVDFVLEGQLKNGSFSFNYFPKNLKNHSYFSCVETASVALIAAYRSGKKDSERLKNGINFLIEAQDEDGSWSLPYIPSNSKYPSVTGFALKTLLYLKCFPDNTLEKALTFIESTQKENGSWGRASEYYNTEGYAIKNIMEALKLARNEGLDHIEKARIDTIIKKSIPYILNRQNSNGSWSVIGLSSKSISTALYMQALLNLDNIDQIHSQTIENAASFLLEQQKKEGFWHGGKLGSYSADFFATSEALIALSKTIELCSI